MRVSTEADVRAFAGNPDIVDDNSPYPWVKWLGYSCRDRACRTYYQINTDDDTLLGFETYSRRWFRTRRGTRVGDTRKRAERRERRKANHNLCGMGTRAILREHDAHSVYILFNKRRVFAIVVDSTSVDC